MKNFTKWTRKIILSLLIFIFALGTAGMDQLSAAMTEDEYDVIVSYIQSENGSADAAELDKFEISGSSSNMTTTTDKAKTYSGSTESATNIEIYVKQRAEDEDGSLVLSEVESYKIKVGSSGLFRQKVKLHDGENIVIIYAEKSNKKTCVVYIIDKE